MVFAETKRILGADEEPYSCTVTIPDDGVAPGSAKNTPLLIPDDGVARGLAKNTPLPRQFA